MTAHKLFEKLFDISMSEIECLLLKIEYDRCLSQWLKENSTQKIQPRWVNLMGVKKFLVLHFSNEISLKGFKILEVQLPYLRE